MIDSLRKTDGLPQGRGYDLECEATVSFGDDMLFTVTELTCPSSSDQ